jgi:glucose-6-phosphate isomerase
VAVTGVGSKLDKTAEADGWLARFPMWDWVGGRTSETGPVGLLPAALQGLDIDELLAGAAAMDAATRVADTRANPAMLLALMWHHATNGKGEKDMVILPYKDSLELFSKYLQQLVMESLARRRTWRATSSTKASPSTATRLTDQHAYVQQLREGVANFFVTFIEVLRDKEGASIEVEPGVTSGDFLQGFYLGTRQALHDNGRESITITVKQVDARTVGMLIALYERAVGFYASLVGINAYHQPGVEAGRRPRLPSSMRSARFRAAAGRARPRFQRGRGGAEVAVGPKQPSSCWNTWRRTRRKTSSRAAAPLTATRYRLAS